MYQHMHKYLCKLILNYSHTFRC